MPDETPVPGDQETPETPEGGSPDEGTPAESATTEGGREDSQPVSDDTNWQQRYQDLQPEYTRATQEAAQFRQLFDLARQGDPEALQLLGVEAADEEDDDEYLDPDTRIDRIEQLLQQRDAEQARFAEEAELEAEVDEHLANQLDALESKHGELDDDEVEYLLRLAEAHPDENGFPDLAAAFEADQRRIEAKRQGWVDSKRAPQVKSGASATHQPDLDDAEQRRDYMARKAMELDQLA